MRKRETSHSDRARKRNRTGRLARAGRQTLRSEKIGALPILNHFLRRLRLEEWLQQHLPPEDHRVKIPAAKALLVLVRNMLISREPLYGVGEWAAAYVPDLLGLTRGQLEALSDDGTGRALGCLFRCDLRHPLASVDHNAVHPAGIYILQQPFQCRLLGRGCCAVHRWHRVVGPAL